MPKMSLTDFVDIFTRNSPSKITKIAQIKHRPQYSPQVDFYKAVRECIIAMHERGLGRPHLAQLPGQLRDAKKIKNYPDVTAGYLKWLGRREPTWFMPPHETFSAHGVDVSVNPELGLTIGGVPHVIKLYFKGESLTKGKVQVVAHLMEITLRAKCQNNERMSILDVRNGKLLTPSVADERLSTSLRGELAYIAAVWNDL